MSDAAWIELDGAVNVRDLGGLPVADGRAVRPHRLIRADNLQDLSPADVQLLLGEYEVRRIVDLRTDVEVRGEGPGPLAGDPRVHIEQLSLFVEPADAPAAGTEPGLARADDVQARRAEPAVHVVDGTAGPQVLPWQSVPASDESRVEAAVGYLTFLAQRPSNVLRALRLIGEPGGATVVHCAAGKDRTGVIVALALAAVGVPDQPIIADYARSAERIELIVARLSASSTYAADIATGTLDHHRPQPASMQRFLTEVQKRFGGTRGWMQSVGWTDSDQRNLELALLT